MNAEIINTTSADEQLRYLSDRVKTASDRVMNYFLPIFFIAGLILASFYDTWFVAITVGGSCLVAYYLCKLALPESKLYQYVLSANFAIFMAQYIYQMHGLFEMHFIAFIGCTILITYQNWRLQIPLLIIILIHHALFAYLQYSGQKDIYFTQLDYMDLQTFIIHAALAGSIVYISGLWAYTLHKNTVKDVKRNVELVRLQKEETENEILKEANVKLQKATELADEANARLKNEIEERVSKSNELQKLNEYLDQFAYVVSHDLKAPLRAINNLSVWIEEDLGAGVSEDIKKNMGMLRGRVSRMESLIAGILEYSRVGRQANATEKLDATKLVTETVEFLSPPESFTVTIQADMPAIYADKVKIQQVFSNLISNAVKYHHTKNGLIKIDCKTEENYYRFSVTDDGPGIAPEYHKKVFDIFQTLQARDKIESTGIGLAIVKKIIEEVGGTIWVESEPGHGASFIFTWPKDYKAPSVKKNEEALAGQL